MQSDSFNSPHSELRSFMRIRRVESQVRVSAFLLLPVLFVALLGCRVSRPGCHYPVAVPDSIQKTRLDSLPIQDIRSIELPFVDKREKGKIPGGFKEVYPLTIEECEGLAAQKSPLAAVLETESNENSPCQPCSRVDPCVRESINSIIAANSRYQRNQSSEKAMLAYLGLVEVYLQNQVVDETIEEIAELQIVLHQLQGEGLLRNVDPESLARKRLEILEKRNELLFNFERLNEVLRALLGLERDNHPLWTDCQISNWQIPDDLNSELRMAFENRADLQSLEHLSTVSNEQMVEALRSSVRSASPLAGLVLERQILGGLFSDQSAEIAKLRSQLTILHSAQVDLVQAQVAEHFYSVLKNHELINIKRQKLASLQKSVARLDAKRQVGPIEVNEVLAAKSELLACRSEIIRTAVELQMSFVRLRSAQGMLGRNDLPSDRLPAVAHPSERTPIENDSSPADRQSNQDVEQISTASSNRPMSRSERIAAALNGSKHR